MRTNLFFIRYLDPNQDKGGGAAAGELSEADIEEIYKEVDKETAPQDDPDEDQKEADPAEAKPDEDPNADPEANPEGKEGDPDKQQSPDEKDKADLAKKPEDKDGEGTDQPEEPTAEQIQAWAEKHKLTLDEAKDDLTKTNAVLKNYQDPAEIARALRSTQSALDKLKNEQDKATKKASPVFERIAEDVFLKQDREVIEENRDRIVENYRAKFPNKSDMMTDEAILDEVGAERLKVYNDWAGKQEVKLRETATAKRDQVLAEIPEEDKRFIPLIKETLLETNDNYLLSDDFEIKHLIYHARGKTYHEDVKAAFERGVKKGKEDPKIIGTKPTGSGPSKRPTTGAGASGWAGTPEQKQRAEEMYSDYGPEEAHKMFCETWKDELRKDRNFVG